MKSTHPFACRYYHDGKYWSVDIHAYDDADAVARVKKLGSLKLCGRLIATIPATTPGARFLVRAMCWTRNKLNSYRLHRK